MLRIIGKGLIGAAVAATSFWVTWAIISPVPTQQASDKRNPAPEPIELPVGWRNWNERLYLAVNPDVAQAVARGDFKSARQHYDLAGATERRLGASVPDDWNEAEYLRLNLDVASAVSEGRFINGYHHYLAAGRHERRTGGFPANAAAKK